MGPMENGARTVFGILLALVLIALGVYGLQNQEHIPVYFLFFTFKGTQAWIPAGIFALLIFAICLVYGFVSGALGLFRRHRLVRASSQHKARADDLGRQLEEAKSELQRLRQAATRRDPSAENAPSGPEAPRVT